MLEMSACASYMKLVLFLDSSGHNISVHQAGPLQLVHSKPMDPPTVIVSKPYSVSQSAATQAVSYSHSTRTG
jgi:hypothetical protein